MCIIKKLLLIIFCLCLYLFLFLEVNAFSSQLSIGEDSLTNELMPSNKDEYKRKAYIIDKYKVNIVVNEDNTFEVTETITAYFNVAKHGIYRKIPLKNHVTRLDGTTSDNKAKIKNIMVNNEYALSKSDGYLIIKIGNKNTTLTGKQVYIIQYTYELGKDDIVQYDELYYNIIGTGWDTAIGNVTFSITMPKEFDASKIGFSSGSEGLVSSDGVDYWVIGNTIEGKYTKILDEHEGLSIRCELPEGYFTGFKNNINYTIFIIVLSVFASIYAIYAWIRYGKDRKPIETIEFYPPNNLNSCELQYILDGKSKKEGVISLLFYLANKGYLEIDNKKKFTITKLKDYDGFNMIEAEFMAELFSYSKFNNGVVTSSDLEDSFYQSINAISSTTEFELGSELYEDNGKERTIMGMFIIILTFFAGLRMVLDYFLITDFRLVILIFALLVVSFFVGLMLNAIPFGDPKLPLFPSLIIIGLYVLPIYFFVRYLVNTGAIDQMRMIDCYAMYVGIIIIMIFGRYMSKRSKNGNELLGKVRGFKTFLKTAEKEQLESLVNENPSYFYNILPYTYALGVSKKWVKKFESIAVAAPNWYVSNDDFDFNKFEHDFNSTTSSIHKSMTSSFHTSSGGSSFGGGSDSSGGGSSGGGSGGGGGGSW